MFDQICMMYTTYTQTHKDIICQTYTDASLMCHIYINVRIHEIYKNILFVYHLWQSIYSDTCNTKSMSRTHSDHCPFVIKSFKKSMPNKAKIFRFETI